MHLGLENSGSSILSIVPDLRRSRASYTHLKGYEKESFRFYRTRSIYPPFHRTLAFIHSSLHEEGSMKLGLFISLLNYDYSSPAVI